MIGIDAQKVFTQPVNAEAIWKGSDQHLVRKPTGHYSLELFTILDGEDSVFLTILADSRGGNPIPTKIRLFDSGPKAFFIRRTKNILKAWVANKGIGVAISGPATVVLAAPPPLLGWSIASIN